MTVEGLGSDGDRLTLLLTADNADPRRVHDRD